MLDAGAVSLRAAALAVDVGEKEGVSYCMPTTWPIYQLVAGSSGGAASRKPLRRPWYGCVA